MKDKLKKIWRTKKKYVILAALYILCQILSTVADPWTWDESIEGLTHEVNSAQEEFIDGLSWVLPDNMNDDSLITKMLLRFISFGADDIYAYHHAFPNFGLIDIIKVTFPAMMVLKILISKRIFQKEKDKVELEKPKFRFLYYRTENILAETAVDDITFYLIGVATKLISLVFASLSFSAGGVMRILSDFVYSVILVFTMPFYFASAWLYEIYSIFDSEYELFPEQFGSIPKFIYIPLINLTLVISFDIIMRLVMRLYELALQALKFIFKKVTKYIDGYINNKHTNIIKEVKPNENT